MIARAANLKIGDGISYSETPIMELLPQYEPFPLRERDVEKAKSLLKEAGYPKGITVTLTYASDHAFNQGLVQAVKELAKDANINVELKGYPRDIYFAQYWLKEPFTLTTWGGRADPSMLLNLGYRSDGPWNESHLNDPKLDNLIDRISMEVDEEIRNDLYKELQQYFIENGAMINIQVPYFVAMNNKIAGYEQPLTMLPNYKKVYIKK
jgi:peptide/nickel transport system substrate-binding protein